MPRLIEVQTDEDLPPELRVAVGDLVALDASGTGGWPQSDAVEWLGAFQRSVAGGGRVLTPAGGPNVVVLRACRPGTAEFELVVGDPWGSSRRVPFRLVVEP